MHRGELLLVVNFGDEPATVDVTHATLLFETEAGVDLTPGRLALPAHAGALLGP